MCAIRAVLDRIGDDCLASGMEVESRNGEVTIKAEPFSARESEILRQLADGQRPSVIGTAMGLPKPEVREVLRTLRMRLRLRGRDSQFHRESWKERYERACSLKLIDDSVTTVHKTDVTTPQTVTVYA